MGNEIPVITQISDEARQVGGSTNILQDVSYRKTGVQLEIKPIVQANGLVDLEIPPAAQRGKYNRRDESARLPDHL